MELTSDRVEITLRLLQNGKYVWTITLNDKQGEPLNTALKLKQHDKELQDAFPNHVKPGSVGFKGFED